MNHSHNKLLVWMAWTAALSVVPCVAVPSTMLSATPPTDSVHTRVDALLRTLARGSADERDQAQAELLKIGPAALPYLPPVDPNMPADFKVRLQRVTTTLENQAAESVWQPSKLSLRGAYEWPQLVAEIKKQTGNTLVLEEAPNGRAEVDIKQTPFWPALDSLLDQANFDIDPYAGMPHSLVIVPRALRTTPRSENAIYTGPLRIEATSVATSRDLIRQTPASARVRLAIAWEPRLSPIAISVPFQTLVAEDENGRRYPCTNPDAHPSIPVHPGAAQVEIAVPFEAPPRSLAHWQRMSGQLEVLLLGEMVEFEFKNLTKPATQSKAGVQVRLQETRKNDDVWEVRLLIDYDETFTGLDSHRGWIEDNPVFVKTADGKRLESLGMQLISQGRRSIGLAFLFQLPEDLTKCTFHYETPAKILTKQLSFQLGKIPLP